MRSVRLVARFWSRCACTSGRVVMLFHLARYDLDVVCVPHSFAVQVLKALLLFHLPALPFLRCSASGTRVRASGFFVLAAAPVITILLVARHGCLCRSLYLSGVGGEGSTKTRPILGMRLKVVFSPRITESDDHSHELVP